MPWMNWKSSFRKDKFFLSNMHRCPVELDGQRFNSAEQAFMYLKCAEEADKEKVLAAATPAKAKRTAKKVRKPEGWNDGGKLAAMRRVLDAKFDQNPALAKKLLETGDEPLVERNNWNENYWGADWDTGEGENHLGRLLMEKRERLRDAAGGGTQDSPPPETEPASAASDKA